MADSLLNIAVVSVNQDAPSETFVKAHKGKLEGNVFYVHGAGTFFPKFDADGHNLDFHLPRYRRAGEFFLNIFSRDEKRRNYNERRAFAHFLKKFEIDVVLAEYGPTGCEIMDVCDSLGIPFIVHFHGFDAYIPANFEQYDYKSMFRRAKFIVVVASAMKEKLLLAGAPPEKLVLNTYGPAEMFFDINPDYKSNTFVTVGRLVDKKAPYLSLAAFRNVHERFDDARFVCLGDGPLLNTCMNLAKAWKISDAVQFRGVAAHRAVYEAMSSAFCYVQHSVTALTGDSEGTPVSILEAGASGLPVISTRHAGIVDVIEQGVNGYLVEPCDLDGMTEYMLRLYEDREFAKDLGSRSREIVRTRFTLERHLRVLSELLRKSVAR